MYRIKRIAAALLCALAFVLLTAAQAVTPTDYNVDTPEALVAGHLYSEYSIVVDADSGDILFEKNAYTRCYPASTTKIMTCILAIENGPIGETVTIPDGIAVSSDSSKLGIKTGEIMSFTDLLYGMMLESGNDAALAVAILVSGSEAAFVRLMNEKAAQLGCSGTHYENAHGYHKVNHYTTAYDLTVITRYAMKNELFRQIVSTPTYTLPPTNVRATGLVASNEYLLMDPQSEYYYAPCIGVKSGSTNAAGRCFVGAATQHGATLISVALYAPKSETGNKYKYVFIDTIRLMKYGFLQYKALSFADMFALCKDSLPGVQVGNFTKDDLFDGLLDVEAVGISDEEYREWYLERNLHTQAVKDAITESFLSRFTAVYTPDPPLAPIKQGNVVGTLRFLGQNGEVLEGTLVAARDVGEEPPTLAEVVDTWVNNNAPWMIYLMPRHTPVVKYVYLALLALIIFLIVLRVRRVREFNRRRRALLEKKKRAYLMKQRNQQSAHHVEGPQKRTPSTRIPARVQSTKPVSKKPVARASVRGKER